MKRPPQYAHTCRSRTKSIWLVRPGACRWAPAPLPLIARIERVAIRERTPFFLPAAAELADLAAHGPRDHLLGVIGDRFLELHPGLREPCDVDGQYQRFHFPAGAVRKRPVHPIIAAKCKV